MSTEEIARRLKVSNDRIAAARVAGMPVCEHVWEVVQPWDPCTNGGAQYSTPVPRACGHTVCAHHILVHSLTICSPK